MKLKINEKKYTMMPTWKYIGILTLFLVFFSYIMSLLRMDNISKIFICLTWCSAFATILNISLLKKHQYLREFFIVFLCITVFYDLYSLYVWQLNDRTPLSKILMFSLLFVNLIFIYLLGKIKFSKLQILSYIKKMSPIIVICIVFIILNYNIFNWGYTPDGYTYFSTTKENLGMWDFTWKNVNSLQIAGHLTLGYTIFLDIGLILFGDYGIRIVNLAMAVVTIGCFYKILLFLFPKEKKQFLICSTMIFSFSPLFLGLIHSLNSDFPMLCFFVWYIWADYSDKRILRFFFSALMCFSKELGAVVLFLYLTVDAFTKIFNSKGMVIDKIGEYIRSFRWIEVYNILFFVTLLLFGGSGWGENAKNSFANISGNNIENKFLINFDFILYKLKEMIFMNWSWVIIPLFIFFLLSYTKRKEKIYIHKKYFSLIASYIGFLLFNLFYFTYPHYRYLIFQNFFYTIAITFIILYITRKKYLRGIIFSVVIVLFITESFYTWDFVSLNIFPTINVGKREIVSTKKYISIDGRLLTKEENSSVESQMFFDCTLNNKDQIGFETITEKALKRINYDGTQKIIFPSLYGDNLEYTLLAMFGRNDKESFYWNKKTNSITDDLRDIKLSFYDIYSIIEDNSLSEEIYYYLQYPYSYEYDEERLLNNFNINNQISISSKGWEMNILEIEKK